MKRIILCLAALVMGLGMNQAYGQLSTATKVVKTAVNHLGSNDITGTWLYEGIVVKFKTDNLLKKAGGMAAANQIEKQLNKQLSKLGFQRGVTTFTFNEDGTFKNTTKGKTLGGKYEYDSKTGKITLKYLNHIPLPANVSGSSKKMEFLFEANGFLSFVTFLGGNSGISPIKKITSILNSYEGMVVGIEFKK